MRTSIIVAASVIAAIVVPVTSAQAHAGHGKTTCERAYAHRMIVIKKHGKRAPGRNICRFGVKHSTGKVVEATYSQKRRYDDALVRLAAPAPVYTVKVAGAPAQPPSGTLTAHLAPTGLASCIVQHESHGDPNASNGTHFGIGQWDLPTWRAHGGTRYAADPRGATYEQQLIVLTSALARHGCSAWCPYDGCG